MVSGGYLGGAAGGLRGFTLGTSDDLAALGRDIYRSHGLIMSFELVFQGKLVARSTVELDVVVSSDGDGLAVGGEGVVSDRMMKQVVNLRGSHCIASMNTHPIGGALYYRCLSGIFSGASS
jgi:hypothetical protein